MALTTDDSRLTFDASNRIGAEFLFAEKQQFGYHNQQHTHAGSSQHFSNKIQEAAECIHSKKTR